MVARAKNLLAHPKKYCRVTAVSSGAYIQNIAFDKSTREIVDERKLVLDGEKYDGYYSIVTSDLNMRDDEIRNTYWGLRIEETFKISKTEFESRPFMSGTMSTLKDISPHALPHWY